MAVHRGVALALVLVAAVATRASAYMVGPAVPLEKLAASADLVCKATVVSDAPVVDPWFTAVPGFEARETTLRLVAAIKGTVATKTVRFRHYARAKASNVGYSYSPQFYEFVVGKTYLVFAARAGTDVFRQLDAHHTVKADQGVMRTAGARPPRGQTITEIVWSELRWMLASKRPDDVIEAIRQLDELSGGHRTKLADLDRKAVFAAIRPKITSGDDTIATAAISVFGADSPYLDDQLAPYWLAGLGRGAIEGLGPMTRSPRPTAHGGARSLIAIARGKRTAALRALAIRALGGTQVPPAQLAAWISDPAPEVRRAGVLVSADTPDRRTILRAVTDASPDVRHAAALAIGFTQDPALLPHLGTLLTDDHDTTRAAAALALLSFSVDAAAPVMAAHLGSGFMPLFVNALAARDPQPYLSQLADVIERDLRPDRFWGGAIPAGVSWKILFGYVKDRPAAELVAGKHDRSLLALERMRWFSSSEPRALYALYLVRGLKRRAARFRIAMRKASSFDIDYYFDMADKSPSTYVP